MKRLLISLVCLSLFLACSSSSKIAKPNFNPEISSEVLNKNGIAAINENYKRNYFKIVPYLFYNEAGTFNEIQGDFYNVDYQEVSDLNIMPGYFAQYGKYKNALVVLVAMSSTSKLSIKGIPISVESSKHGTLKKESIADNDINRNQQRALFVMELDLNNKYDILKKINDDVITVTVGNQIYKFLNPEVQLE